MPTYIKSQLMSLFYRGFKIAKSKGIDRLLILFVRLLSYNIGFHRCVGRLPRPVSKGIFSAVKVWTFLVIKTGNSLFPRKYTDADPYKTLIVDPRQIRLQTCKAARRRGWVENGSWDRNGSIFWSRSVPKAIRKKYTNEHTWQKINISDISKQRKIENLYNSIKISGYKSQHQLLTESPDLAWDGLNDAMHPLANEIAVDIGRNGELLWNMCGQHRLAIAKVLGIEQIPVQVFRRHTEWQEIRNKLRHGESIPDEFYNHPDLQDLINKQ